MIRTWRASSLIPAALVLAMTTARGQVPDDARPYVPRGLEPVVKKAQVARHGPVVTATLELALVNDDDTPVERVVSFGLPADAVIGRLALEVPSGSTGSPAHWMEGEVLSQLVASQHYEGIKRPATERPRDPALLSEVSPGRWQLRVFPVPPGGERRLVLVVHRLQPDKPGTWIEEYPVGETAETGKIRWFAIVPRWTKPAASSGPIIVALDLSLSMRNELGSIDELLAMLARRSPELVLVWHDTRNGALKRSTCAGAGCIDLTPGGGTNLEALLAAAFAEADKRASPAEVVLVTDGRATEGRLGAELAGIAGAKRHRLNALGLGTVDRPLLEAVSDRNDGVLAFEADEVVRLLSSRSPAVVVTSPLAVADVSMMRGVGFGRMSRYEASIAIDDRQVDLLAPESAPRAPSFYRFAALARMGPYQRLDTPEAAKTRLQIARVAGIAAGGGALLALENEEDYTARGIVRRKAAELAALDGLVGPVLPPDWPELGEVPPPDADGDGFPDRLDACPQEPGPAEGCPPRLRVRIEQSEIRIIQHVFFSYGSAKIDPRFFPLLDEIVQILMTFPELTPIGIEGHADSWEGRAAQRLSEKRALAVKAYLVGKGLPGARFVTTGFGMTRPIDDNRRRNGRAKNRRTELRILGRDDEARARIEREALERAADPARLVDPMVRAGAALDVLEMSATLLERAGRLDEARVRRAEVVELRREREGYKPFTR